MAEEVSHLGMTVHLCLYDVFSMFSLVISFSNFMICGNSLWLEFLSMMRLGTFALLKDS